MTPADIAWILTATALVLFMTLPGLALFYGGLVRSKNYLSILTQCFGICAFVSVAWMAAGYAIAFGADGGQLIGSLKHLFLLDIARDPAGANSEMLLVVFQMTFAIITPALIIGAVAERIKFSFVIIFSVLWVLFCYAPVAHWVWGGGLLSASSVISLFNGVGVQDLAGGVVVHVTAGVAALVLVLILGARDGFPQGIKPPHQPGLVMIGAAMLWVGWFGFNGGSPFAANNSAVMAVLVTHLSASAACITWALWERMKVGKVSLIGIVTGMVAGLASITPAAGHVGPIGAIIIGGIAGILCQEMIGLVKHRLKLDDSLDVFAVHGVGGILGTLALPLLAAPALGGAGLAEGVSVGQQLLVQFAGILVVALFTALATALIALLVKAAVGMRAEKAAVIEGLDYASHGESAYNLEK